ncbi:hypothetical protein FMM58_03785 [Campylobacter sp. LR291e]|uniref:hypothetical protein n=1 Tax=Campylobacter sp. LR291e TaxID=2593546 RepID=UPI001239CCD9|nr:hypothetical protein [Campylobacter sp. LR291e]KAA6231207.1 hypothetical protein FMM58_03785 [Campylobacter sp. LR291e]
MQKEIIKEWLKNDEKLKLMGFNGLGEEDIKALKDFYNLCFEFTTKNGFNPYYLMTFKDFEFTHFNTENGFKIDFLILGEDNDDLTYFQALESFFFKKELLLNSYKRVWHDSKKFNCVGFSLFINLDKPLQLENA